MKNAVSCGGIVEAGAVRLVPLTVEGEHNAVGIGRTWEVGGSQEFFECDENLGFVDFDEVHTRQGVGFVISW